MPTGYEAGYYSDVNDIARSGRHAAESLGTAVDLLREIAQRPTHEDANDPSYDEDSWQYRTAAALERIADALEKPAPIVTIAVPATCWCGGRVGFRDPGDDAGLGCWEDLNHDWRGIQNA